MPKDIYKFRGGEGLPSFGKEKKYFPDVDRAGDVTQEITLPYIWRERERELDK